MVTQVTTVLLTSLGTDWTQSHQGNNNAMLLLFSVIFQKEFLIPSYIILLRELTVALVLTMPFSAQKYFQLVYSSQFVIIITMNCACVVFKTPGTWSKTGRRKDTFLHHSVLVLFLSLHLLLSLYLEILQPHNLSILLVQGMGNHCKIQLTFVALGGQLTTWFFLVPLCTAE